MNKRIEELFNIATYEPDRFVSGIYYPYIPLQVAGEPLRYSITEYGYQKFAKLIVQDCISQIAMIGVSNCDDPDVVWTVDKAIQNIKQHFGVEE